MGVAAGRPVCVFDKDKKLIATYSSIAEAAKKMGMNKSNVDTQCRHLNKAPPKFGFYFRFKDEVDEKGFVE